MFKNIGIYVKEKSGEVIDSQNLDALILSLKKHTSNVYIEETSEYKNSSLVSLKYNDFVSKIDLIIVFGGDGTLLRAARNYLEHNIPILGINMGTVGFLTDIKIEDFESVIKDVLAGNCEIEERNLVCAQTRFLSSISQLPAKTSFITDSKSSILISVKKPTVPIFIPRIGILCSR